MTLWLLWLFAATPAAAETGPRKPACVDVRTEARYRNYGYDHLVTVLNGCDKPVSCDVSTNVSPQPNHVSVPARSEVEVLTFRASPAREFSAKVDCRIAE